MSFKAEIELGLGDPLSFNFKLKLECGVGKSEFEIKSNSNCRVLNPSTYWPNPRRRWWRRRAPVMKCLEKKEECDQYIKGFKETRVAFLRWRLGWTYWMKNKKFVFWTAFHIWGWKWRELLNHEIWTEYLYEEKDFKNPKHSGFESNPDGYTEEEIAELREKYIRNATEEEIAEAAEAREKYIRDRDRQNAKWTSLGRRHDARKQEQCKKQRRKCIEPCMTEYECLNKSGKHSKRCESNRKKCEKNREKCVDGLLKKYRKVIETGGCKLLQAGTVQVLHTNDPSVLKRMNDPRR